MFKLRELPSTVRHPLRTHILKFPPTKNWRGMIVVVFINQLGLNGERVFSCVSQFGESNIFLELVVTIGLMLSSLGGERLVRWWGSAPVAAAPGLHILNSPDLHVKHQNLHNKKINTIQIVISPCQSPTAIMYRRTAYRTVLPNPSFVICRGGPMAVQRIGTMRCSSAQMSELQHAIRLICFDKQLPV
jgi:hypothetical protein